MATPYAFVTLLTSDTYLPGALTLAAALKEVHPRPLSPPEVEYKTVCLVTPESVDVSTIKLLRRAFDEVIGVEILEQDNEHGLKLLGMSSVEHYPTGGLLALLMSHCDPPTSKEKIFFFINDLMPDPVTSTNLIISNIKFPSRPTGPQHRADQIAHFPPYPIFEDNLFGC